MSTIKKSQTQPATSYQRPLKKSASNGAASLKLDTQVDLFETRTEKSVPATQTPTVVGTKKKSSTGRKIAVRGGLAATAGAILGFAGYGIYAAAPHIAAGVVTAAAIPAVHFIGIGVAAGLALALVGFAIYAGVKKYKAWQKAKNTGLDDAAKFGPRAPLSEENLARAVSVKDDNAFDPLIDWVNTGNNAAVDAESAPLAQPQPKRASPQAQTLYDALIAEEARKAEQTKADAARAKRGPAPKAPPAKATGKVARFALNLSSDPAKTAREANQNWDTLENRGGEIGGHAQDYKNYYAQQITAYESATTSRDKQDILTDLQQYQAVFPEVADEATFEQALKGGLKIRAETWDRKQANR